MFIKIYRSYRRVVALCDSDLLGKKFEEGKRQLDVRENFYKGDEVSNEAAADILKRELKEDATFNIVGPESVKVALETGVIAQENIGTVQNIPFALKLV